MDPLVFDHDVETVVGNGRLIARARAASAEFVFAGPSSGYRLLVDGEPADAGSVRTVVVPGRTRYETERGAVTLAAQPDAALMVVLVESDAEAEWTLELTGPEVETDGDELALADGVAVVWTADPEPTTATREDDATGALHVRLDADARAAFLLGDASAAEAVGDPFEAVQAWAAQTAERGLRLRTPVAELDRAVEFAKAHLLLGYDWVPDAAGRPGGDGSKMVCDIFRWRDVWSRDFGSGFGPGGLAAGLVDAVLATLDYEADRYSAHDPTGLKVSDDTSQGGSAEGLGWLLKLVWRVYKHTGDAAWLARMTAAFEPWVEVWIDRDADRDGLIVDVTEWMDHSRFLRLVEGQRTLYSNALYYAALRRMAMVCRALGRAADAGRYDDLAARSRQSIHDAFWNDTGYFNNAVQWGVPDTALMLADNAIAVGERIASRNERFRTLETIRERSWRPFGTVTTDLPMRYVPADNDHNGRVWPWWMAHEAKARFQNFDADGGLHVLSKIVDTFARPTLPGLCEEYLDPEDGAQDDVVGHAFITGSGAMLDAVQYGLVGLSIREPGERAIRLAPATPRAWEEWSADLDLVAGRLEYEQTADGVRVVLDGTAVERLELRVPPREALEMVTLDGTEITPEAEEDGASEYLRVPLAPGGRHVVEVAYAPQRVWSGDLAMPPLPAPFPVERPLLMDEPRLFADILQDFVRSAVSYFGRMRHVAAREIGDLDGDGDLLVIVGNELPFTTKRGRSVTDMIDGFLDRGGSLLLLGPRFPRIDLTDHYHGGAQMGGHAGLFWWKRWADGRWQDVDPRDGELLDHPEHQGTVYWGDGPLFAAWEHGLGLFGFETECRGVFDVEGGVVDPDQRVEVVYTDWSVRKPWTFTPLAFTEREHQLVTGPRRERYPCAALLHNEATGARIVVVAPSVCSRTDLLHRMLAHVAAPVETVR
ncbi:GH116 family glycosyl hydrolase [Rubrivirga sp.]|uniref:alpha-L-rhamnosidase-related protein n=1 Tax=Rubrivirga sp. TaxID=1885344 RepID=UPI003B52B399